MYMYIYIYICYDIIYMCIYKYIHMRKIPKWNYLEGVR